MSVRTILPKFSGHIGFPGDDGHAWHEIRIALISFGFILKSIAGLFGETGSKSDPNFDFISLKFCFLDQHFKHK